MKHVFFHALFLILVSSALAQNFTNKTFYFNSKENVGQSIVYDDGYYYVLGLEADSPGQINFLFTKIDTLWDVKFKVSIPNAAMPGYLHQKKLVKGTDSVFLIAGAITQNSFHGFLQGISNQGNLLWSYTLNNDSQSIYLDADYSPFDSSFYATGFRLKDTNYNYIITKIATDGTIKWHREYPFKQGAYAIKVINPNLIAAGGSTTGKNSNYFFFLIDSTGKVLDQRTWGTNRYETIYDIEYYQGNYYLSMSSGAADLSIPEFY